MKSKLPKLPDGRWTVTLEWCGDAVPRYILRFCGDWVCKYESKEAAYMAGSNLGNTLLLTSAKWRKYAEYMLRET